MSNRLLDIIAEPDNTIIDMRACTFKQGDFIFHHSKKLGTAPGVVVKVGAGGRNVKVEFDTTPTGTAWVKASNCQLQDEWRKEYEQ